MNKKLNKRNSRILHQALASLGALKGASSALQEMHINEIQVHLLDERGDGVILCLEYEEPSGEITKTFSCVDEFYADTVEVELEESLDPCISPENVKTRFEEVISEEYEEALSEIFHNSNDGKPPLLN